MFPTLTIYTVNADVTLLNAIFNGVAMVCQQTALIWGFAMLAATWRLVSMTAEATIRAENGPSAGSGLPQASIGLFLPFILAMLITNPALKSTVIVESSINGNTTNIANVPFVVSVIPATASLLSQQVGGVVETAFQGTGTNYPSISASGNGFINSLKMLLTSRTAVMKMGSINSQVNSVISACLGSDFGADYSTINGLVINAGNTGATGAQTLSVYDQTGAAPGQVGGTATSIGALLYQASLNLSGMLSDTAIVGSNSVVSCADAAAIVATNINKSLYSPEFARIVQGAVNSADQPNTTGSFNVNTLSTDYQAVRTANTVTNTLADGVSQANSELVNLLFAEMVKNDLDCLKADSTNKTTCLAMAVQGNEIERNNIQAAANGVEGLLYAGQFSNYITALIIGLGPVIILFMMFSGVGAGKNMRVAVHMIVWPLLIMNVGAELINGMIYNTVANFMTTISQSGYISQAVAVEVYKHFSLQIGTASHLIATLPILMTTIFALGESAALVSISNTMGSNSKAVSEAANPPAINTAPLLHNGSMAEGKQGDGFYVKKATGALDAVSTSTQYGNLANRASQNIAEATTKQHSISSGEQDLVDWKRAFQTGNYSKFGLNRSEGEAIKNSYENNLRASENQHSGQTAGSSKSNSNTSKLTTAAGVNVGTGGLRANIGANGETGTAAADKMTSGIETKKDKAIAESNAMSKALTEENAKSKYANSGSDKSKSLQKSLTTQKSYADTLTKTDSITDTVSNAVERSQTFVEQAGTLGSAELANHSQNNQAFKNFQVSPARLALDKIPGIDKYKQKASEDMRNDATEEIGMNDAARGAVVRHLAAVRLANDAGAKPEDRMEADKYLVGEAAAMQSTNYTLRSPKEKNLHIPNVEDKTGINKNNLIQAGDRLDPNAIHRPAAAAAPGIKKPHSRGAGTAKQPAHLEKPVAGGLEENAAALKKSVIAGEGATEIEVIRDVKNAGVVATNSGLRGPDSHGTVIRTAATVVANTGLTNSRTELGDLSKTPQVKQPPTPAPPKVWSPDSGI